MIFQSTVSKRGKISCVICKPVFVLLSNKIIFEGRALIKTLCKPCFIDYQLTANGILRNKGPSVDSFGMKGIIIIIIIIIITLGAIVHSCTCNKSLLISVCFVSFRGIL